MNGRAAVPSSASDSSKCHRGLKRLVRGAAFALAGALASGATHAQQALVNPGDAVVTGFAGVAATQAPQGANPFDYVGIDLGGASARVVDLSALGPQGGESTAPKPFTVTPAQVGQVFGVVLDDADPPNIYLAATSAYGLSIGVPDASGQMKRVEHGEAGAQFVPGQFGPQVMGGSPGSIWRVDGATGDVSLFATVGSAGQGAAALGGLAYDPATRQIFAADLSTGIVYRYGLDGTQQGTYDHGVEGRPEAGLPAIALTAMMPVDITSPSFDTTNPASWGFAPPARRVFALAVHDNRLFYSIAQGPQVWSVRINPGGTVTGDARMEVEVPALQTGVEITSIAFDGQGRMYLAERGATTGDYTMYALANGGQSRVLRYLPNGPGQWQPSPQQYSVGMAPNYDNADGGVALSYGYAQQGNGYAIDQGTCDATVWSTGGRLLDPGDPNAAPGSFPYVDGLQGNAVSLVQPQNTPPTASWFVDYDDKAGYPEFRGYMGAIATLPCAGAPVPPPPATCSPGYYLQNGQCLPPPISCPSGTYYDNGQCFPVGCPQGMIKQPNGQCSCPSGEVFYKGQCLPPQSCQPPMVKLPNGLCWCPLGMIFGNGVCQQPTTCGPGTVLKNGQCVPQSCPPHQDLYKGQCVPECSKGQVHTGKNGACKFKLPKMTVCVKPNVIYQGKCMAPCPLGKVHTGKSGACKVLFKIPKMTFCVKPKVNYQGKCLSPCAPGEAHTGPGGKCEPYNPAKIPQKVGPLIPIPKP